MRSPLLALSAFSLLTSSLGQLDTFRATVEGSLHQCAVSQLFFFDSGNARPLTVLFLPSSSIPDSARSGTVELADAMTYDPVLTVGGIETADAAAVDFTVQIAAGTEVEVSTGATAPSAWAPPGVAGILQALIGFSASCAAFWFLA